MKFIFVHREPIVDRVPNLKSMMLYALEQGHEVLLITTKNPKFPEALLEHERAKTVSLSERSRKLELPSTLKIGVFVFYFLLKEILTRGESRFIFAGRGALIIAAIFRRLGLKKYAAFVVEYPNLEISSTRTRSKEDMLEFAGIFGAKVFITHDDVHGRAIEVAVDAKNPGFLTLPNSTLSPPRQPGPSDFLHKRLSIASSVKIILHSGGFGEWFSSQELAAMSCQIGEGFRLVFHLSHDISQDGYFKEYREKKKTRDNSIFSMDPVRNEDLDALVASAHIGVAWYNLKALGFRAEKMGFAAGKIGSYLKCGIPVIAPNFESLSYIREYRAGILIDNLDELNIAIETINKQYEQYTSGALRCYRSTWEPRPHLARIYQKLGEIG